MTTKQQQIAEIIRHWYKLYTEMDAAWDGWAKLGVGVEAPFPSAAWEVFSTLTYRTEELISRRLRPPRNGWLMWWLYEKPKGPSVVKIGGREYVVTDDIESLIAMHCAEAEEES